MRERDVWERLSGRLRCDVPTAKALVRTWARCLEIRIGQPFLTTPGVYVEGDGQSVRFVPTWFPRRNKRQTDLPLRPLHLAAHLLGDYHVAQQRLKQTAIVIIDLDCHGVGEGETLTARQGAIEAALHHPPLMVFRSSSSNGRHMYIFLDRPYDAAFLAREVTSALLRAGYDPEANSTEVFPRDQQALRLPLGGGSALLHPDNLFPIGARLVSSKRGPRLLRDLSVGVRTVIECRDELQTSLAALLGTGGGDNSCKGGPGERPQLLPVQPGGRRRPVSVVDPSEARPSKMLPRRQPRQGAPSAPHPQPPNTVRSTSPRRAPITSSKSSDYFERLKACENGISDYGQRYEEGRQIVWDLYVRQGFSKEDTLRLYRQWLERSEHLSHDLEIARARTIGRMMRTAERWIDRRAQRGGGSRRAAVTAPPGERYGSLSRYYAAAIDAAGPGGDWRAVAEAHVTAADRAVLATVPDDWLVRRLARLVGLIRLGRKALGDSELVTFSCEILERIAGKKKNTGKHGRDLGRGAMGKLPARYILVVRQAVRLRWVRLILPAERGVRAASYRVTLPGDDLRRALGA